MNCGSNCLISQNWLASTGRVTVRAVIINRDGDISSISDEFADIDMSFMISIFFSKDLD